MQTKNNPIEHCEFKFANDGYAIEGYGNRVGIEDKGLDTIHPGAYEDTLKENKNILMRYEHVRYMYPGKWLSAKEDSKGLFLEGELTKGHSIAEDARLSMKHGVLGGLSIGYIVPQGAFQRKTNGGRDIYKVNLVEVSLTATPMEEGSLITSFKSEVAGLNSITDFESFLRDSGMFSKSMAQAFIGQFKSYVRSESESIHEQQIMQKQLMRKADDELARIIGNLKIDLK